MTEAAKVPGVASCRHEPADTTTRDVLEKHPLDGCGGAERENLVLRGFGELSEHGSENSRRGAGGGQRELIGSRFN